MYPVPVPAPAAVDEPAGKAWLIGDDPFAPVGFILDAGAGKCWDPPPPPPSCALISGNNEGG